jgi:TIR domain-containing protein
MNRQDTSKGHRGIFISYTHADAGIATKIAKSLTDAGLRPWIDTTEVHPGDSFLELMNQGLGNASYLVALLSTHSAYSRWMTREWMAGLASRDTVVIPVLLDDSEVPPLLRDIVHFDMSRKGSVEIGIQKLKEFFLREYGDQQQQQKQQQQQQQPQQRQEQQQQQQRLLFGRTLYQIRLVAVRCIDSATLRAYCFDADFALDNLEGLSLTEKLLSLLHKMKLEHSLDDFVRWLEYEKKRCVEAQISELSKTPAWNWGNPGLRAFRE